MSALASFRIDDRRWIDSLMLYGFAPMLDAGAVRVMRLVTLLWAKEIGSDLGPALPTIHERPVVVIFPWPQGDGFLASSELLVEMPVCLATALAVVRR